MAKQIINIGTTPDDGTGDTLRAGLSKANSNFTELYDKHQTKEYDYVSLSTWTANHGLNRRPEVRCEDGSGNEIIGDVKYDTLNLITVYFNTATSGKMILT